MSDCNGHHELHETLHTVMLNDVSSYLLLFPIVLTNSFVKFFPNSNPVGFTLPEESSTITSSSPPLSFKLMNLASTPEEWASLHPVSFSLLQAYSSKLSITFLRKL